MSSTIPQHLPEFKRTTLLFVCDTMRAKWYVLSGRTLQRIGAVEHPKPEFTDQKGHYNIEEVERQGLENFSKEVAVALATAVTATKAVQIILCVPQRIKGGVEKHLSAALKKKIIRQHDANLYRFNGLETLKLIYK